MAAEATGEDGEEAGTRLLPPRPSPWLWAMGGRPLEEAPFSWGFLLVGGLRARRFGELFGCKWLPWGSPARALLATPGRHASCNVTSWYYTSPPLSSSPSELASLIESTPPTSGLPCTTRYPSVIRRGSLRPQGVVHKSINCDEQFGIAMTGLVIGSP